MGQWFSSRECAKECYTFPKVQLHYHLDGGVRFETILELAQRKQIDLKGAKTVAELKDLLVTRHPTSLADVLRAFEIFMPVFAGDLEAIEQVAFEACEDQHKAGVVYFEGRYSPHFFAEGKAKSVPPADVVKAVCRGFARAEQEFGIKARSILCCIRSHDLWNKEVISLCESLKEHGVVAIDVAGCAGGADEKYERSVVLAFQQAARLGIHRTVHAGESSGSGTVLRAVNEMHTERIGHGYHLLDDPESYDRLAVKVAESYLNWKQLQGRLHLEACPLSSVMTGSVPLDWPSHPVARWARDDINFSISTDDPTCFDNTYLTELELVRSQVGLTLHQLWKCQLNAAESCFAEEPLKSELIAQVKAAEPKTR